VLHSSLLSGLDWLTHGFGTRNDTISQDEMASLRQIHSATVLPTHALGLAGEGDALVTADAGIPVSVRTADCYPILLADVRNRAIAAIHAGWRGTAAGIVTHALESMRAEFGTQAADVRAAIGPGIGVCCYEVGEEVARLFGLASAGCIDLAQANRSQLIDAGVGPPSIEVLGGCTRCSPARYHSFRRDQQQAGRMISFVAIS
jgi:hypothetical protein